MRLISPYPLVIDLLIVLIVVLFVSRPWQTHKLSPKDQTLVRQPVERQIAAAAIKDEVMAGVTVASILLVAIGGLGLTKKEGLSDDVKKHLGAASLLCILSLFLGLWVMGSVPTWVNFYNVAQNAWFAAFAVAQLAVTFLAGWRVFNALRAVLR